jgi:3-isopropylmalate/(R)-2-methylmalate dehydratase small subunit
MKPFTTVHARALSMPESDIDTDVIYPARFLLITEKAGLGGCAFYDRRGIDGFDGVSRPVLVTGANFGCGSSREHAAWALADWGVQVIIAPSFGEIFHANAFRNGLLPIRMPAAQIEQFHRAATEGCAIRVDLEACEVQVDGEDAVAFEVEADRREALLNGWNDTTRILAMRSAEIEAFEQRQREAAPWLWSNG